MAKPRLENLLKTRRRPRRRRWAVVGKFVIVAGVLLALATYLSTDGLLSFGGKAKGLRLERERASPNFVSNHFVNSEPTTVSRPSALWTVAGAWLFGKEMRVPVCPLPMAKDTVQRLAAPPASGLRLTWLGHSTVLIEIDGVRVLTDPQWSARASPSRWAGPRRFHPPPLPLASLPKLDAVVISHDHYDHLDMDTVRALGARGVTFYVGLGVGAHLERWGIAPERIVEQDAWETSTLPGGLQLVSTPSRHFSGRGLVDRNPTRWTSWTLIGPKHKVFFSGDTGLTEDFRAIGQKLGPFDVALVEIGAFHPSWGDIHLGPTGALTAQKLLDARRLLPIHWSTFDLALHAWSEPAETLYREAEARHVSLLTPRLGEPVEPTTAPATGPWWRVLPPMSKSCP